MAIQHEKPFESEICGWLDAHDWWYRDEPPFDLDYDKASALYLPDLYGWLYDTQPEQLAKLVKQGASGGVPSPVDGVLGEYAAAAPRIKDRVVKLLGTDPMSGSSTLNVLKNPVDVTLRWGFSRSKCLKAPAARSVRSRVANQGMNTSHIR